MSTEATTHYQNHPALPHKQPAGEESDTQPAVSTKSQHLLEIVKENHPPNNKSTVELSHLVNLNELRAVNKYHKKIFPDAVYEGELYQGKRHGRGIMRYQSGRVYEGQWANDKRNGKGYEKFSSGNTYEGDYMEGVPDGRGIYTWKNGEVYDGEWRKGKKYGDGVWKGREGDYYIGEWKDSKANGYGVHVWKNGDRYEGEWKDCLKHGNGTDIYHNGDSYVGQYKFGTYIWLQWRIGKPCGYGQFFWKNGSMYSGEFLDGLKHGFGRWRKSKDCSTNIYEGQYFKDKKQGFGIFKWASGNIYIGQYKNDERDGVGEMKWIDGSVYIGQWEKGIQNGYGRMYFPDGTTKEGVFENNVFKGLNEVDLDKVPRDLFDKAFDIMTYAPKDIQFSDEIIGKKGVKTADHGRRVDTGYTNYSMSVSNQGARRTLSKNPGTANSMNYSIKKKNRSFAISSRGIAQNRKNEGSMPPVYENARKKKRIMFRIRRNKNKKAWVPTGKANYVDVIRAPYAVY